MAGRVVEDERGPRGPAPTAPSCGPTRPSRAAHGGRRPPAPSAAGRGAQQSARTCRPTWVRERPPGAVGPQDVGVGEVRRGGRPCSPAARRRAGPWAPGPRGRVAAAAGSRPARRPARSRRSPAAGAAASGSRFGGSAAGSGRRHRRRRPRAAERRRRDAVDDPSWRTASARVRGSPPGRPLAQPGPAARRREREHRERPTARRRRAVRRWRDARGPRMGAAPSDCSRGSRGTGTRLRPSSPRAPERLLPPAPAGVSRRGGEALDHERDALVGLHRGDPHVPAPAGPVELAGAHDGAAVAASRSVRAQASPPGAGTHR